MKRLITTSEVIKSAERGQKILLIEPGTLVTPAAVDAAEELGVRIQEGIETGVNEEKCLKDEEKIVQPTKFDASALNPELIAQIVSQVIASLPNLNQNQGLVKESDPSGLRLIRGSSVVCEKFETGNPNDKVTIREILNTKESPNMSTGFMEIEKSTFSWDLKYEELDYIVEGTLEFIIDGRKYTGKAGDVFYLPKDTTVTFSSPDYCKYFFVTYPANWAELSNYEK